MLTGVPVVTGLTQTEGETRRNSRSAGPRGVVGTGHLRRARAVWVDRETRTAVKLQKIRVVLSKVSGARMCD